LKRLKDGGFRHKLLSYFDVFGVIHAWLVNHQGGADRRVLGDDRFLENAMAQSNEQVLRKTSMQEIILAVRRTDPFACFLTWWPG